MDVQEKDATIVAMFNEKIEGVTEKAREGMVTEKAASEKFISKEEAENMKVEHEKSIARLREELSQKDTSPVTLEKELKEKLTADVLSVLKKDSKAKVSLELKAAANMSNATAITGQIPQAMRMDGVSKKPYNVPLIADLLSPSPVNSNVIEYVEEFDEQGAPAFLVEQQKFPLMSVKYRVKDAKVKKVGAHIKVTREMLSDVSFVLSEIQNKLVTRIALKADQKMLSGDEDTNAEEWDGLIEYATAFDNDGTKIAKPTNYDVVLTANKQLRNALRFGTALMIHPDDMLNLRASKDENGNYVNQMLALGLSNTIEGLRIIENPLMTKGKFIVADLSFINYFIREGMELDIAYENEDDFLKDLVTIKGRMRAAFFVKSNDTDAFIYGDWAAAITALTPA